MIALNQTDRAALQFLGSLQYFSSSALRGRARQEFAASAEAAAFDQEFAQPADDNAWAERIDRAREVASRSSTFRLERFFQRYVAEHSYIRGIPAIEANRAQWEAWLVAQRPADTSRLLLDPDLAQPAYADQVEWHLEPGGYDGYDLQGPLFMSAIGPHVFSRGGYAAVAAGADIQNQRQQVLSQFRNTSPKRIYDMGCGGAMTLSVCRRMFPDAELIGGDLSAELLRAGHMMSEAMGMGIVFRQEDARHTAEADNSCDAIISYAVHHEMPRQVNIDTLREMFRILTPGGEMVISDPPPFRAVPPFQSVLLNWEKENRVEPWFAEFCATDLAQVMRDIGFVDVEEYPLEESNYPWITRGRKPA
jgi:ubiquinone/menaquinone biosynthesis C-methylase UbiE